MASYNYKGTKITGTSTKAKVFKKSKIKKAKKNQTYLNKSTGHVYKCTHGGKPSEAKWKYTRTDIVAKPSLAVQGLGAPTRNGTKMNAAWNIPADLISNKKGDRATGYNIYWYLGIPGNDPSRVLQVASAGTRTSQVDLNNFWVGNTKYDRKSFYPNTKKKLSYVSVKVAPKNAKGEGGKPTTATRNFEIPRVPTISGFSFNNETGVISVTITTDPGNDYKERYDTKYKMTVTDTRQDKIWAQIDDKSTNTSITLSYNIRNYQELTWDDYVKVTVTAYARGYAGASATASKTAYVSFPQKTTIEDVAVTGKTGQDKCTVLINTNSTTEHPVDRVRLEYLANCIYDTAESIPSGESWTESDIVDDASCTAMSISVSNLIPERGHYTWVRVVSWHYNENVLYRVSDYMRVTDLETPAATAADDEITILSASPGEDGRSIIVELGWNADGEDDSDGTELSWADEEDTWKSTRTPDSFMFEWSDGPVTVGQITYQDSATITIKDLQEGTRYFIRARRYMEGETTEYSPYSNTSTAITSETPETIVATCDRYVAKGHSLAIYWTFSGNGVQKEWQIVAEDGTVIANGDDSMTTTQISSSRLESLVTDNTLSFTVQASTGGNFVVSDLQTVTIVDNPELDITGSSLVHVHEEAEREFSGEIVTFEPDSNERLKSLAASIEPKQSGTPWQSAIENAPYLYRATSGGTISHNYFREMDKIIGGSVVFNQLIEPFNTTSGGVTSVFNSATGVIELSGTSTGTYSNIMYNKNVVQGHKYYVKLSAVSNPNNLSFTVSLLNAGVLCPIGSAVIQPSNGTRLSAVGLADYAVGTDFTGVKIKAIGIDLTQMFGSTIADYVYQLEQSSAGAGVAWLKSLGYFTDDYYPYNAGEIKSVSGLSSHDMVGFNQFDIGNADFTQGNFAGGSIPNNVHTEGYTRVAPNATYNFHTKTVFSGRYIRFYDANKNELVSERIGNYSTSDFTFTVPSDTQYIKIQLYKNTGYTVADTQSEDICINISDTNRNGEYEPYVKHSYPLDNTITLRGIPQLSDGKIYYDGDTYNSDGSLTRNIYHYTFTGSESWVSGWGDNEKYYSNEYLLKNPQISSGTPIAWLGFGDNDHSAPVISDYGITSIPYNQLQTHYKEKAMCIASDGRIGITKALYDDVSSLTGKTVYFIANEPTKATAEPYSTIQICDSNGTEEYVTDGIPVGHETIYAELYPLSGFDEAKTYVSPTQDEEDATVYNTDLPFTTYGGTFDVLEGVLNAYPYYASYNGETINGEWVCDRAVYSQGATPPIGSQVALISGDSTAYTLTPTQIALLTGTNNIWADTGSVDVVLTETTKDEDQLQTNNLSLEFTSNRLCDLIVIVTSQGAVGQFPAGIRRQTAGDTIHSAVYSPEWTEDNDVFTASINLPTGLDFWDLGRYTVSVVAIDRETGLRSEEASASFAVEWAKQAVDIRPTTTYALSTDTVVDEDKTYYTYDSTTESYLPVDDPVGDEDPSAEGWYEATVTNYITLTPIDEIDDTGYHRQAVQIALIPPPGSETTDLYDIYRLTGDGAVLIGESFPLTCTTTDEYAPFGEDMTLNYRVALRTIDGDVSFADFEYVQDSSHLRFDWATGFVEYPYNLSIGDSYKKDVEFRSHLDGGIDGYWNQNVERQAKLSTDLIWIEQQDVIDKTRELARYAGPVYVRTPEGTAYEADVQVTDMSGTDNIIMAVAIDATEVDVTAEFLLPTPYRKEEESE